MLKRLSKRYKLYCFKKTKITSIFGVGCGCGANLFLFKNDGLKIGGMDYSSSQIEIAKKLFDKKEITELICGEAIDLPTDIKYDAIISNSHLGRSVDIKYG